MKKMIILFLLAAMLLMLAGCGGAPAQQPAVPETTEVPTEEGDAGVNYASFANKVNVLCYNIYYQDVDARQENIQDLILKNDPDVLLLQEVSYDWIPYIKSFMEENNYSYYGYGRHGGELLADDVATGDQFVPILWKTDKYDLVESGHFWLSSTPDEVKSAAWVDGTISKYPRCVNWVILKDKETGGSFVTMNIHTDPESDMVRTNSCKLAVEMLNKIRGDAQLPVVVAGDWNMGLTDTGYAVVTQSGYPDVRIKAEHTEYGGSFNAWGDRADDNFAYGDHIFMSENMAAEVYDVVDDYYDGVHISDHCPLYAVLYY